MHGLRNSRRFGRLLAVWLLSWFIAMAVTRVPPAVGAHEAAAAATIASAHVDHEGHHHHGADAPEDDEATPVVQLHAGHASGSPSHCPLCTHGAAPPPPRFAPAPLGDAPADHPATPTAEAVRVRTDAPPPARGPPLLS